MRPERLHLVDILEGAEAMGRFLQGVEEASFLKGELRQGAVLQKLIVIGGAEARLPKTFTRRHPHIPWPEIVAFRNMAAHGYFAVGGRIVWVTAKQRDVPRLGANQGGLSGLVSPEGRSASQVP